MKRIFAGLLTSCLLCHAVTATADCRRQIPPSLQNSWIYLSGGVANTYLQPSNFDPRLSFGYEKEAIAALRISIGHYFNPNWAVSLSLMRGAHSNKLSQVQSSSVVLSDAAAQQEYSLNQNLFTATLRPTLPLGHNLSVYGEAGLGMISRRGFNVQGISAIDNANVVDAVVGGGLNYRLPYGILLGLDSEYAPPVNSQHQPGILYVGVGLGFQTDTQKIPTYDPEQYVFPLNLVELSYINQQVFYADVARYFTPPYIPVFFDGAIKIAQGLEFMYERNFFHTDKNFSLEWGVSAAGWESRQDHQSFYTLSIFPELKVWIVRLPSFDFYFTYSLAGPSYISRRFIDGIDSGSHFTFQDFLGFGALLGKSKRANISLKIVHYSNGNSLPENPGVDVPIMLGLGYAW